MVVTRDLLADDYWLPAGVYMDQWMVRKGVSAPCPDCLLGGRGVVTLSAPLAS